MSPELFLATIVGLALHVLAAVVLIKHRRHVKHHRFEMGTIGRDPALTEALHARLSANAPETDWLCPYAMNAKIHAWQRAKEHGGTTLDAVVTLACCGILIALLHVISRYIVQSGGLW